MIPPEGQNETRERPRSPDFHAFISHAGEDKVVAGDIADALAELGWTVWLDKRELFAGPSLRQQLDNGLSNSRFGVVLISEIYMDKYWTGAELDAIFGLESGGRSDLIPVLIGISHEALAARSPILAGRFAVSGNITPQEIAVQVSRSMERLLSNSGPWSSVLRRDATDGLVWERPPQFFPESLALTDKYFVEFWAGRDKPVPQEFQSNMETPSLPQLFDSPTSYVGKFVGIVGHQEGEQHLATHHHGLHEYVLRLRSRDEHYQSCIVYVRLAEFSPHAERDVPKSKPAELAVVTGTVIARGAMRDSKGALMSAVYIAAARLYYVPVLVN